MKSCWFLVSVFCVLQLAEAFQPPASLLQCSKLQKPKDKSLYTRAAGDHGGDYDAGEQRPRRLKWFSRVRNRLAFMTTLVISAAPGVVVVPQAAKASAPLMAVPKEDRQSSEERTKYLNNLKRQEAAVEEQKRQAALRDEIVRTKGAAAASKFDRELKESQMKKVEERTARIEQLKSDLLDQGICPYNDVEGDRQMYLATHGLDLATIKGTRASVEKDLLEIDPEKSFEYKMKYNRDVIKLVVQDMRNRGIDPVAEFDNPKTRSLDYLQLKPDEAEFLAERYSKNMELYGQIEPPKEGEMSAKEKLAQQPKDPTTKNRAKLLAAEAKAKAAAEKKAQKEAAKAEAAEAKAAAKAEKERAKAEAKAAKAASKAAAAVAVAEEADTGDFIDDFAPTDEGEQQEASVPATQETNDVETKKGNNIKIVPVVAVLATAGGGTYAAKIMRDRSAAAEAERQRQFKLLMGEAEEETDAASSATSLDEVDSSDVDLDGNEAKAGSSGAGTGSEKPVETTPKPRKKKKKSFFGKKKNNREVDFSALVGPNAKSPEFAKTLAKVLSFGAPGRFPDVLSIAGEMPMQEFNFEEASDLLEKSQGSAGLSKEEGAEVFANVVNCMLIDIVDLASSSLKEKNNKVTVEAIDIVVDFMNHAASLYNSIAEGVVISPVTYGGELNKGKLEQMYSTYAVSGMSDMSKMSEDFETRVSLLQDVFEINEKKAEGLMMKALQKNMMEMLKSGEGLEGMEDMMKGMQGLGIPGMDGEQPSPEQLKDMLLSLKELKDSGSIPASELDEVKKQFKDAFGSSFDELAKGADHEGAELSAEDKELLELMKSILG